MKKKRRKIAKPRPRLWQVSEEMQQWSSLLTRELENWPAVRSRPMFGMRAFYRGKTIFALLPERRSLETPNAVCFKLHKASREIAKALRLEERIRGDINSRTRWFTLELESARDLKLALHWFERAYKAAQTK